ncbi:serine/threonine protein kinase [Corynebacterium tapiri]|uniref:non-specific serine/threonine protein kinase n=1 Tax=Corynebacterium tapiri TaxID=1448266 RepID=A0A5C4U234_9CORY|nr:serine/threonine protein kinase [Corynebacterium tapiri]TNL95746.1 serine/threonine protein kinase [Corynebacterium tapiri]
MSSDPLDKETPTVAGTEAVIFDPFAEDDDSYVDGEGGGTEAVRYSPEAEETSAVPFDPFADDSEPVETEAPADARFDTSARARQEALTTFRSRHGITRSNRPVADGMVHLPFIPPRSPEDALRDPEEIASRRTPPPQLQPGDIVANQYEILGVIGHGGMGWIYLAHDHHVSDRLVVLKGMQSEKSRDETAAAGAEREFLAGITHPGIVKIFNFIDDPRVPGGFIVMEFVGGPSLRARRNAQEGHLLPIDVAIGYILEVLPALDYLHSRGVVYNDFKPDNIIVTEDQVKLIDLGAVSGIGAYGYIYGTRGFQAPDVATDGPSVASDIYTVGRTLAALTLNLPHEDGVYEPGLPSAFAEPTLRRYPSFYGLLKRATHRDPAKRFKSVSELEGQLYGVLREVLALRDGTYHPAQRSLFSPQRTTYGTKHLVFRTDQLIDGIERTIKITADEVVSAIPTPLIDSNDVGAGMLTGSSFAEPQEALDTLQQAMDNEEFRDSTEIPLGVVRAMLDLGHTTEALAWLDSLEQRLGDDWRIKWYSGVTSLLRDDYPAAQSAFAEVMAIVPGEPAPKLALAAVDELMLQAEDVDRKPLLNEKLARATSGLGANLADLQREDFAELESPWDPSSTDPAMMRFTATHLYGVVWATNPTTVSSAFGLSRQLVAEGLTELAVQALDRVPQASRHQRMAMLTTILELVSTELTESRIRRAARRLEEIPTNEPRFLQIKTAVMSAGLEFLQSANVESAASRNDLFEFPFTQTGLRYGLADTLRQQARLAPSARHRYALVDMANRVRPVTWF